ncbi:hypothetical protein BCR33DRAFT_775894 [Rhizoclosmatium globosum]|uniref:N-acetyltransferase domain-containing protein n=1 Tax=Rhizoclosmatium globosum TaxID=329046 RepID=A0A1Y2AIG3_9FUNG|nr:hypothetical protein BCR33DRAFT_775894 [Rhizoclosmatium globosum]|eukprot:ORY22264.1 hypothetical protein BCR33DRAFT_775894 [Rhizoclosmatium globosum]
MPPSVELRPITAFNVDAVNDLRLSPDQYYGMVYIAFGACIRSFQPSVWTRLFWDTDIDKPVGMVQISLNGDAKGEHKIEAIGIDERYQGKGYGRACMNLVLQAVKESEELPGLRKGILLEYAEPTDEYCPRDFYLAIGFRHTGKLEDEFIEMYYAFEEKDQRSPINTPPPTSRKLGTKQVLIAEETYFAKYLGEKQFESITLGDFGQDDIFAFYWYDSLGPMCLSNVRWLNWAVYQPKGSVAVKVLYSTAEMTEYKASLQEGLTKKPFPKAVGYIILKEIECGKYELKHMFVNPSRRGQGIAKKGLRLLDREVVVFGNEVERTRSSLGLAHLRENQGMALENCQPLLMNLGFKVDAVGQLRFNSNKVQSGPKPFMMRIFGSCLAKDME